MNKINKINQRTVVNSRTWVLIAVGLGFVCLFFIIDLENLSPQLNNEDVDMGKEAVQKESKDFSSYFV